MKFVRMIAPTVPVGFEAAHKEWLSMGGKESLWQVSNFYETGYWQLVRQAILASKDFVCCRCGGEANQVHHLNYDHVGEDHFYPKNLVTVCRLCHGMVEYARKAEALVSRIERRIRLCEGFLEGASGCESQNAAHVYTRLLEYQDELAVLMKFFSKGIRYSDCKKEITDIWLTSRRSGKYEEQAQIIVSKWNGNERGKAERVLSMLDAELANCWKFVEEVFAPVPE